jgi:hypothetical protein
MMSRGVKQTWQEKFNEFDTKHPEVYELFRRLTFEMIVKYRKRRIGVHTITGKMRWDYSIGDEASHDGWKLNENFGPYMARKFMREFPEWNGFFETRALRSLEAALRSREAA